MKRIIVKQVFRLSALMLIATALTACQDKKAGDSNADTEKLIEEKVQKAVSEALSDANRTGTSAEEGTAPTEAYDTAVEEPSTPKSATRKVYMGMWGNVGGTGFMFDMDGTTGSYIPYDMAEAKEYGARRQLRLVSYNPKTGKCIINAFLKGKYIGQFDGIFEEAGDPDDEESHYFQAYNGLFKSINGDKLEFHFHFD
ncbi:MAG: hypothetical protein IJM81_04630 [Prevotella sp.]|nr:hypothetical protein [Prevotella sp.]